MKTHTLASLTVSALIALSPLLISGCDELQPQIPTPAPRMIPYVDDPFAESGIRATPDAAGSDSTAGAILVEWYSIDPAAVSGVQLGGYYVYRARREGEDDPQNFVRIQKQELTSVGSDTSFIDTDIEEGYIYSYYVTSYNHSDASQESLPSDTVQFMPTTRPILEYPQGKISLPASDTLHFYFGPGIQLGRLVAIEVNEVEPEPGNEKTLIKQIWRSDSEGASGDPHANPYIAYRGDPPLLPEHRYRWRIIKYNELITAPGELPLPMGNTSKWMTFTVLR